MNEHHPGAWLGNSCYALQAAGSCPGLHVQEYAEEGALLVACYGGVAEDSSGTVLECLQPFSEVWNAFVASGKQVSCM